MKPLTLFCLFLVAYGLFIWIFLTIQRESARASGPLVPFDEDGERVFVPALGTICLAGGIFVLVLDSARKKQR